MLDWLVAVIPAMPLASALALGFAILTGRVEGERSEFTSMSLAFGAAALSALALAAAAAARWLAILPSHIVLGRWIECGRFQAAVSFSLDNLSLGFSALIAVAGLLVLQFARSYLHREPGFHRFFLVLSLFIGAMHLLALGGNVAITFLGWELAGVCSYLLIVYAHDRPIAADNATYAFVINRIGDAAFVLGLVLSFLWVQNLEWPHLVRSTAAFGTLHPSVLALCFLVAAMTKSAQIPFTPWITGALEGPTPSSALFYGTLLVHTGIYLILKLQPLLESLPGVMALLAVSGACTALYGYFCGLTQHEIKSALMFSTVAQVGLMFLACGLGWWTLATVHLFCHAIVRLDQFLNAPSVLHRTINQPVRPVAAWWGRHRPLYIASLHRLWLEALIARLGIQPVSRLATDLSRFERNIIEKGVGLPVPAVSTLSSLAAWEERRLAADTGTGPDKREISGLLGYLTHHLAAGLHWFEEKLVLQGVGNDLWRAGRRVGHALAAFEQLLREPRYLLLIVLITLLCAPRPV